MVVQKYKNIEDKKFYQAIKPDQTYKGLTYADLIADWMNWVYSDDPDERNDNSFTYLRGNNIGDPYNSESSALSASTFDVVDDIKNIYDRTGFRGITITSNSAIFFPVFDTNFVLNDTYLGKVLQTPYDLRIGTRNEYNQVSAMWATIQVSNGEDWVEGNPIVEDLSEYYAESYPFQLFASAGNKLNREPKYYLQGPHDYLGVSVGTYLLLSNFKPGKYRLDFGGISRVPYFTRAVYDITVIETSQPPVNDISSLAAKKSFTPKPLK